MKVSQEGIEHQAARWWKPGQLAITRVNKSKLTHATLGTAKIVCMYVMTHLM